MYVWCSSYHFSQFSFNSHLSIIYITGTKNASSWENEMRELSVRRAKRLRDIKVLIQSLRENITLLGLKDAELTVHQHFESNHQRVVKIYKSVSEDRVHEITLSSESYDVLKEMSTWCSSVVFERDVRA